MCRFYGWDPWQVENMPVRVFNEYFRAMDVLSAEEQLSGIQIALSPDLKKEKRGELIRKLEQRHRMVDRSGGKLADIKDVAKAFARMKMDG